MEKIPTVIFNYRVDDILEEVTKRTSKFGQMRSTEQEPFLVDRLSLTRGENFMFSEFLEDAVSETYDWLRAFGRNIPMYDKIVLKYEDIKMLKDYGAKLEVDYNPAAFNEKINVKGIEVVEEDESTLFVGHYHIDVVNTDEPIEVSIEHNLVLHTTLNGERVSREIQYTKSKVLNKDEQFIAEGELVPFEFVEDGYKHEIDYALLDIVIKVTPVDAKPINKGTYVEYHNNLDNLDDFEVYQVNVPCTTADWMDNSCSLAVDPRGCIVLILEQTECMDFNLIPSIDRNIKEALVNYIIHRWFEYTNAAESGVFYEKFENYAHKAQLGMNSETKILKRRYNINF